jgi:lysophospholipase
MEPAPFHAEMAQGPEGGAAWYVEASDGVRLRVGHWPVGKAKDAARGTVLLFPGRTEYIEKYGRAAQAFADCGLDTFAIDWRGQGLADRLAEDEMAGHVLHFLDFQKDVAAMMQAAEELNLPRPYHLLAHSMGGCIGLRAVMEGLDVASCVFTGPMWGIRMSEALRPVAWSLSWGSKQLGVSERIAPGSSPGAYVLTEPFETNRLTRDAEMYDYMIAHLRAVPELSLGGPSLHWLHEALVEMRALRQRPAPALPCLTLMGSDEDIVEQDKVRERMARWPGGRLEVIEGGRHEVLMEDAETRGRLFAMICEFYHAHALEKA